MNFQEKGKDFIEHYGIKGMRWGVRRTDAQLAKAEGKTESDSADSSSKSEGKTATKGRNPNDLSDKELQAVVNRINMEQQYTRLTVSPTKTQKVTKFMADIAVSVAKTQITAVANDKASAQIGKVLTKKAVP